MSLVNAISVSAARAYRTQARPTALPEPVGIAPKPHINRRNNGVKIDLSPDARRLLAQTGATDMSAATPERQIQPGAIAPDGVGRREAPMRTSAPAYRPPGGKVDLRV